MQGRSLLTPPALGAPSIGNSGCAHVQAPTMSRRTFVQTSVASSLAGALAAWAPPLAAASSPGAVPLASELQARAMAASRGLPLYAAVLDERFAEALRFGQAARERGLATRGVHGDMTDLWNLELHALWKEHPVPLAGLTAYAALFCLEQLAWDHRMRIVYHAAHQVLANGTVEHLVSAPEEVAVFAAPRGLADWPEDLASMIAHIERQSGWSGLPPARRAAPPLDWAAPPVLTLHSWVIARPARA